MPDKTTMTEQILDSAQRFVQTHGYHGFSYANIAEEVGIRKASIHYYYPAKADLGTALVRRYREHIRQSADAVTQGTVGADEQLQRYAQIFRDRLRGGPAGGGVCLCGVLSAEWPSLPESVRVEVGVFFAENEAWLSGVMERGCAAGLLRFSATAPVQAAAFLAGLEGALLSARAHQDVTLYCAIAHQLLGQMGIDTLDIYPVTTEWIAPVSFVRPNYALSES